MPSELFGEKTILVVDNDENELLLIQRALRKSGVTGPIRALASGNEAIRYLLGEGKYSNRSDYPYPTFILTDLKMPDGDGFDVLYYLKSNPEFSVIPIVVLSGSKDPDDIKTAYRLGASSFHLKPNGYEELVRLLRLLYGYWMECEVPEVDPTGRLLETESKGKLGERFDQLPRTTLPPSRSRKHPAGQ